jgi:hypothetical protein
VADSCEQSGEFLDQLSDYQLLKNNSAPRSWPCVWLLPYIQSDRLYVSWMYTVFKNVLCVWYPSARYSDRSFCVISPCYLSAIFGSPNFDNSAMRLNPV